MFWEHFRAFERKAAIKEGYGEVNSWSVATCD